MVIKVANDDSTFEKIAIGNVFRFENDYFIKTSRSRFRTDNCCWNAFNLSENCPTGFEEWVKVTPMIAELTLKEK